MRYCHRLVLALFLWLSLFFSVTAIAQDGGGGDTLARLEQRLTRLEQEQQSSTAGIWVMAPFSIAFLSGALCALWAQNTGRSAWLWFFLGFFLSGLALIFMLTKNADSIHMKKMREGFRL